MGHQDDNGSRLYIDAYVRRARAAQAAWEQRSQEDVDLAVMAVGKLVHDHAAQLAAFAVEETGMGNVHDKTLKNTNKARIMWHSMKGKPSRGIIERDAVTGITKIAKPVGIVAALTPCTNPIVTAMSNIMFALKAGNAIILSPHHKAVRCSAHTVGLIRGRLSELGFPEDVVQVLDEHSREHTANLMAAADVVIATGGMGMVKAAYRSGRPAFGVGAGNVQCIIDRGCDYEAAVEKIITGRTFDYGIICSAEQSVICPEEDYDEILRLFEGKGCVIVRDAAQKEALRGAIFREEGGASPHAVGQSPLTIAELAGIDAPEGTRLLVAEADGTGTADPLGKEKMCPVLTAYRYKDIEGAIAIARENLEAEGKGHSVSLHSDDAKTIEQVGCALPVSRFLVNQVSSTTAGGSFHNGLNPTNTLGCGSWGNNSISENLTYTHLMNVSRIAYFMEGNPVPGEEELWSV
jgi:succinate-semialdehyde dehydrogenase